MKRFLLLLTMVLSMTMSIIAGEVVIDLTKSYTGEPTSNKELITTFTTNDVNFGFYKSYYHSDKYVMIAKSGGYITFSLSQGITKFVVTNTSGCSTSAALQLSNNNANIGNSITLANRNTSYTFDIPSEYQKAGVEFKLATNDKNCQLAEIKFYTIDGPVLAAANLRFPQEEYTATIGENFEAPILSKDTDAEAIYASSDTQVATVDEASGTVTLIGRGTTTITASTVATDTYAPGSASYNITVIDPNALDVTFDLVNQDYTLKSRGGDDFDTDATIKDGSAQIHILKVNGQGVRLWSDGLRVYNGGSSDKIANSFTVSAPGYIVTSVEFALSGNTKFDAFKVGSTEITASNGVYSWSGSVEEVQFDAYLKSGNKVIKTIKVEFEPAGNPEKGTASISFPEVAYTIVLGEEFNAPTAEIVEGEGSIAYNSSNTAVAEVDAENGAVTIKGAGTTTITATLPESNNYNQATASYTLTVIPVANTLAEVYAVVNGNKVKVNFPMTVVYKSGSYCYTISESGSALVYGTTPYAVGNVIPAGWIGEYADYNGLPEIKPSGDMPESTDTAKFEIGHVNEVTAEMLNQVVTLDNVTFADATPENNGKNFTATVGETSYEFRTQFGIESVEAGTYNVTLAVGIFNSTLQCYPIAYEIPEPKPEVGEVTVNFEVINESITAAKGATVVFQAANADGMQLEIEGVEEPQTCEDDTYMYKVTEEVIVTVTPMRNGELFEDKAEMYMIILPEQGVSATNVAGIVTLKVEGVTEKDEVAIYYMITPTGAAKANAHEPIEGYTKYTQPLAMDKAGTISAYAVVNGVAGDVANHEVTDEQTTGVEDITVDNGGEVEYFDLQGRAVANPRGGIFIRRCGGTTVKVAL